MHICKTERGGGGGGGVSECVRGGVEYYPVVVKCFSIGLSSHKHEFYIFILDLNIVRNDFFFNFIGIQNWENT